MVELIGLATLCMLLWVLASSMTTEIDAEKRRATMLSHADLPDPAKRVRHAA